MNYTIKYFCLFAALITIVSCSQRHRSNPLDPQNNETEGKVNGISAVSERQKVTVSWSPVSLSCVEKYNIYKSTGHSSNFVLTGEVKSGLNSFTDSANKYDSLYNYCITAYTKDYESPFSDTVSITPGPLCFWLADRYGGLVARLSYDIRHWFFMSGYLPSPMDISADPNNYSAWVVDRTGYIANFSAKGEVLLFKSALSLPTLTSFDWVNHRLWVVEDNGSTLSCFDTLASPILKIDNFSTISSIDWSEEPSGCWIVDSTLNNVYFVSDQIVDTLHVETDLENPSCLTYFRKGNLLYIADGKQLIQMSPDGRINYKHIFSSNISKIICGQNTGSCWIAEGNECTIKKISISGEILLTLNGFSKVISLVSDSHSGGAVVADIGRSIVVHVSGSGEILNEFQMFSSPWALAVE